MQFFISIVYRQGSFHGKMLILCQVKLLPCYFNNLDRKHIGELAMTLRSSKVKFKLYLAWRNFCEVWIPNWICMDTLSRGGPNFGHFNETYFHPSLIAK